MKMNELSVFNTPVCIRGNTIGHQWGDYAKFSSERQAKAAAHAINNHDRLAEENAKLRHELANLIYMAENNTGHEPSLSCFHLAIDEAKQLLNQLKDQNNDK